MTLAPHASAAYCALHLTGLPMAASLFRRLGGGNFGITYEAVLDKKRLVAKTLTSEQKKNRVVVKKVREGVLGRCRVWVHSPVGEGRIPMKLPASR